MSRTPFYLLLISIFINVSLFFSNVVYVNGLGSSSTISITYSNNTVCGVIADEPQQRLQCYSRDDVVNIEPNISFGSISGGKDFFCGLRSDGLTFLCWDAWANNGFTPKRVYFNTSVVLKGISVGEDHVCGVESASGRVECWYRGGNESEKLAFVAPKGVFKEVTSGKGFSCGVLEGNGSVKCWGSNGIGLEIEEGFQDVSMANLVAGYSHACGVRNDTGGLLCNGRNNSGQLNAPAQAGFLDNGLALGMNHSCAIRKVNGTVVCWGEAGFDPGRYGIGEVSFESIVAGLDITCGLTTRNLSVVCWGPDWNPKMGDLPLQKIVPGLCVQGSCSCGVYPDSESLCSGNGNVCKVCEKELVVDAAPPDLSPPPAASKSSKGWLVFMIVGSVGGFAGICTIGFCLWTGICCCRQKKIHNSVQPTITGGNANATNTNPIGNAFYSPPFSRSSTIRHNNSVRRQSSRAMRRQKSGTSSSKNMDRAEEFSFSELANATNHFSMENRIGSGSFGTVYKGKLFDGREVAIKRGDIDLKLKKLQEKENAFQSELAFLSRLHHKHLVGFVGFCEEKEERLLVYEFMKNGALYNHLHLKENTDNTNSILNSWKVRIKIALDAARGIEYLHSYAVPPIIHRDIKSSNILLDASWTARVSDFGLSLLGPESENQHMVTKAAGTVGYMDPEYYESNVLTVKSDVFSFGVVLLELLTGKRAILTNEDEDGLPISMAELIAEQISKGELGRVLDPKVGLPEPKEMEAVELVAYTALPCVNLEGRERPSMTDIVANLERALALCDDSHGSISSISISIGSD